MSAYSGTPTILRKWEVASRFGQQVEYSKDISLVLVAQGGLVNTIGKVALGFAEIYSVLLLKFDVAGTLSTLPVFTDGTNIYVGAIATGLPADTTGTLTIRVTGKP
jgi:hypothetical protein